MLTTPAPGTQQFSFPQEEEKVLAYWKAIDAFKTSLKESEGRKPFSFYDGPPFATGLPHYGHLLAGTVKDIITRHATSMGYYVDRRFGWDCHGLPVEHEIDKKLEIKTKHDVEKMGLGAYNSACREIVMRYQSEWKQTVERMGRWIDFDNGYKTMDLSFMESVWWVFGQLHQKGLVHRGTRVMPYSNALTTPLSNFEAGLDYREVQDPAITITFPLVSDPKTALLAWTTTPWTLPSNLAVAVHPEFTYLKIFDEQHQMTFIILEKLLTTLYKNPKTAKFTKVGTLKGKDLAGLEFVPMFDYFVDKYPNAFRVVADEYVTDSAGTGLVQQAPAFGEDDARVAIANGIISHDQPAPCPLTDNGEFTDEVSDFEGMFVKDADKHIMKLLKERGRLVVQSTVKHSYPYCWRSGQPLIYKAIPSWFVRVEPAAEQLLKNNATTYWVPSYVGENRFGNWLAQARDWNVSRNRYWGTPLPLWVSDNYDEIVCVSSVEELERLSGVKGISDIHPDKINHITIPSKKGNGVLRRTPEVFDCWFESGSMPYAQSHYPFENKEKFEASFPADFISEGIDQTRGWFYTLLILGTHLFGTAPWKNVIVSGLIQAEDGKKMSKSKRNFPDPTMLINKFGADAIRLYLVSSGAVRAESLRFREDGVREVVTSAFLPWLNSFRFFLGQVALLKQESKIEFKYDPNAPKSTNTLDRWILARLQSLIKMVADELAAYRLYQVIHRLLLTIDELTNWYIRFNRDRLKGVNGPDDTVAALNTLFEALFTLARTMSSFTPFLCENLYQGLRPFLPEHATGELANADLRSVHFLAFPQVKEDYLDPVLQRQFGAFQAVVELGRKLRTRNKLPVRVPLQELRVYHAEQQFLDDVGALAGYVKAELNVVELLLTSDDAATGVEYRLLADWPVLGKKLRKDVGKVKAALPKVPSGEAKAYASTGQITVAGIALDAGDLKVSKEVNTSALAGQWDADSDGAAVVLLDLEVRRALQAAGNARELVNRVQRLRKKAGLQATDAVDAYYTLKGSGAGADELAADFVSQGELLSKLLRRAPRPGKERGTDTKVFAEETTDINEVPFTLELVLLN